jgi:ABC-type thiamine transport system ATPase subunit
MSSPASTKKTLWWKKLIPKVWMQQLNTIDSKVVQGKVVSSEISVVLPQRPVLGSMNVVRAPSYSSPPKLTSENRSNNEMVSMQSCLAQTQPLLLQTVNNTVMDPVLKNRVLDFMASNLQNIPSTQMISRDECESRLNYVRQNPTEELGKIVDALNGATGTSPSMRKSQLVSMQSCLAQAQPLLLRTLDNAAMNPSLKIMVRDFIVSSVQNVPPTQMISTEQCESQLNDLMASKKHPGPYYKNIEFDSESS